VRLIKDRPGIGWVRANQIADENTAREMLRLRVENEDLRRGLEKIGIEPPVGSEVLASGDEEVSLHFSYTDTRDSVMSESIKVTWNKLFQVLGPLMIDVATDGQLKDKMSEFFRNLLQDESRQKIIRSWLRDQDFQVIKLQFVALGLIRVFKDGDRPVLANGTVLARWSLTPYGETLLTQSMAIHKDAAGISQ
jgi:hypothetical protein